MINNTIFLFSISNDLTFEREQKKVYLIHLYILFNMVIPATRLKSFEGQHIEVDFLFILFPFVPIRSRFVIQKDIREKRTSMRIKPFGLGILKAYLFWVLFYICFFCWVTVYIYGKHIQDGMVIWVLTALVFSFLTILFHIKFGKSSEQEEKERAILQKTIGINALPEWLERDDQIRTAKNLKQHLPSALTDWKKHVKDKTLATTSKEIEVLFTLASYEKELLDNEESELVYQLLKKQVI